MEQAKDILQQVCSLGDIEPGAKCESVPSVLRKVFWVSLDRESRQQNPLAMEAEIKALIYNSSSEAGVIIYTKGYVIWQVRSSLTYVAQVGVRTVRKDPDHE